MNTKERLHIRGTLVQNQRPTQVVFHNYLKVFKIDLYL